jgi:hypothetical protein
VLATPPKSEFTLITVEGKKTSTTATVHLWEPGNNRPVTSYYDATEAQVERLRSSDAADRRT